MDADSFEQALRGLPDAMLGIDGAQRIVSANARAATLLLGEPNPERLIGTPLVAWLVDDEQALASWFSAAQVGHQGWRRVVRMRHVERDYLEVDITASQMQRGDAVVVIASLRDVSPWNEVDRADPQGELLRQAIQLSRLGVFHHDHTTGELYWSKEMLEITGRDEPPPVERFFEIIHPDERERVAQAIAEAHAPEGDGRYAVESRSVRPDGSVYWAATTSQTYFVGKGPERRPVRTLGVVADITERRQAEISRHQLEDELQQARKMEAVGRLAGGVAHDFNNILSVILGIALTCKDELEPDNALQGDLADIVEAAERAANLTAQLLAFSRKQVLQPRVIDVNETLKTVTTMLRRLLREDIELLVECADEPMLVCVDPSQLEQVLLNLAVNARDAIDGPGQITFETRSVELNDRYVNEHLDAMVGPHVVIAVSDTGRGMDDETRARVFEPFFTTKGPGQGTGLGLATVFGVIKQSGGNVWVYSEPGRGTTFKLYFPRVFGEQPPDDAPVAGEEVPASECNSTILLVEDEDPLRPVLARVLERQGFRVLQAADAFEAIAIARTEETIDLLLTDVVMPKMSGRALANTLLAELDDLRVIFMSGYTESTIVNQGGLGEGVHFLPKPVTPGALLALVRQVLSQPG